MFYQSNISSISVPPSYLTTLTIPPPGTNTQAPGLVTGQTPTAQPGLVSGQTPTAQPGLVSGQTPTAQPGLLSGQTPTAQPGLVSGQTPTAQPGLVSGQTPTAKPGLVSGQTPTAQPGLVSGQTPTAQPGLVSGQTPTAQPGLVSGQTPLTKPHQDGSGKSTTPAMPYTCKNGWSDFMNIDNALEMKPYEDAGPGDYESIKELRKYYSFCANPIGIKCQTVADKLPYHMSVDVDVTCDLNYGLKCLNSMQGGFDCGDYEISVNCDCGRKYCYLFSCLTILMPLLSSAVFFKNLLFSKDSLRSAIIHVVSNGLDLVQEQHYVGPSLCPNSLQKLLADD